MSGFASSPPAPTEARAGLELLANLSGYGQCALSPDGLWCAVANAGRVSVRSMSNPEQVAQLLQCVDKIDKTEFSPNSNYIMCAMYSRHCIQIFSLSDPKFQCRINESVAGLLSACWAPNSRAILTESDFGIQMSLWSLEDSSQAVISLPKPSQRQFRSQHAQFSDCGQFLAVVHRIDLQDMVGVYSVSPPTELTKFKARSGDVNAVYWTASGHILTVDSPLSYKVCVYSPAGDLLALHEAYTNALGVRSLAHTASWLAVGSFDGKVRLFAAGTWALAFTLPLCHVKDTDHSFLREGTATTVEVCASDAHDWDASGTLAGPGGASAGFVHKMLRTLPKSPAAPSAPSPAGALPAFGAAWLGWAPGGALLAATEESSPRCLWIWQCDAVKLAALLVLRQGIAAAAWRPQPSGSAGAATPWLAICTGTSAVYLWSPDSGPRRVELRVGFAVVGLRWSRDGQTLALRGKDSVALCRVAL